MQYEVRQAEVPAGTYRNITGNLALSYGLVAAARRSGLPLFLGTYPITPASDILHELSKHKRYGITTFQAEDEIAGIGAALGAAYGGAIGVTSTSGPGLALKSEALGLAWLWNPLLVIDVQRVGRRPVCRPKPNRRTCCRPCSGGTAKRPVPHRRAVVPGDCFAAALEAVRIATWVPHPGAAAVRRLSRQRRRALASPGGRVIARSDGAVRHSAQ